MPTLRERLIEAGFWGADDPREPGADHTASLLLLGKMKKRLAPGSYVSYSVELDIDAAAEVSVVWAGGKLPLSGDNDLNVAMCKAALALPSFLEENPQCAAGESGKS